MRILRSLSRWLVPAALLIVVLVAAALAPAVQTWAAQILLSRRPALQGSLDWVTARFGKVEISNLRLNLNGAVLTVPALEARLPITTAVVRRRLVVRQLVAKGWKLDFSRPPAPSGAGAAAAPSADASKAPPAPTPAAPPSAEDVARVFLGVIGRLKLPCDLSLDGVDLEGDIVLATAGGTAAPVHVTVKGGGMAPGRDGEFAVTASTAILGSQDAVIDLAGHGRLLAAMATPRTFRRLEIKSDLSADGGPFPNGLALSTDLSDSLDAGGEAYVLDLRQGDRHAATFAFRYSDKDDRLAGTWKVDLQNSDVALVAPSLKLPQFVAKGDGEFDTDLGFSQVHARGRLNASVRQLHAVVPWLARLDHAALEAAFELHQSGKTLRVDRLSASVRGDQPVISARALQPFEIDEATGGLSPARAADDWMDVSVRGVPAEWLADVTPALVLSGGEAAGEFLVHAGKGGFAFHSKAPVTASGVALQCGGRTVGRDLDLSFPLSADCGPDGWTLAAAPLNVGSGGGRLAEFQIKASRPAAVEQPTLVQGTWKADLQAPNLRAAFPDLRRVGGRSASGDFKVSVGEAVTEVEGTLAVAGRDEHRSLTASVQGTVDPSGRISFKTPLKLAFGPEVSDLTVEGTVIPGAAETGLYLKLNGKSADLDQLRLLTGAVAAAEGLPLAAVAGAEAPDQGRDKTPFWGLWAGRVIVELDRLKAGNLTFENVGGALQVDHRSVQVEDGRGMLSGHQFNQITASLSFDAAAESPYRLKATAAVEPLEVGGFFPPLHPDASPSIEGRFSFAGTVTGTGMNLGDLLHHTQEELRLASTAGIVRIFKTDVDEAIPPDNESAAADTAGRIGTALGKFFGVEDADRSARKKVGPMLQAALDVVNASSEIGFDQCSLTAVRSADGAIRLTDLVMVAGDERITGSGQISPAPGKPFQAQPLTLNLQIGARGHLAKLFSAAGLLSAQKDDQGYELLSQPLAFGGTVGHIDNRAWHELLVKSAMRKPDATKKEPEKGR